MYAQYTHVPIPIPQSDTNQKRQSKFIRRVHVKSTHPPPKPQTPKSKTKKNQR